MTASLSTDLSAIVVNWNGAEYLAGCVDALLAQEQPPAEILIVDNHSTDGSRDFLAERYPAAEFPTVRVIDSGRNGGPCFARNVGMREAQNELCLLIDNDVILRPGALAELRRCLESDPQCAMVQARSVCGDDESVVHYDGGDLHFLGTLVLHNWYRPLRDAADHGGPVGAAVALCFLTRRSAYHEVGGFDENLFILYEDNEFSYKLRMRGYTIRLCAAAVCVHLAGTADLSIRGAGAGARYPGRRTYLHSKNRWYVLLTCMRWRTLLLTIPAQLVYGAVYAAFGHQRGHVLDWWRGKWELFKLLPTAVRARSAAQRGRSVPDRELLTSAAMTLNPGLAEQGFKGWLRRSLDRFFAGYWRLLRGLCG